MYFLYSSKLISNHIQTESFPAQSTKQTNLKTNWTKKKCIFLECSKNLKIVYIYIYIY